MNILDDLCKLNVLDDVDRVTIYNVLFSRHLHRFIHVPAKYSKDFDNLLIELRILYHSVKLDRIITAYYSQLANLCRLANHR